MRDWYRSSYTMLTAILLPFSAIFYGIVQLRRFLYEKNFKKKIKFSIPIVIVGNITVGGTGKTPCVIRLAQLLKEKNKNPAIISRGYGSSRPQKNPIFVDRNSDPRKVGDEPVLMARRCDCPVVVCVDRVEAVRFLLMHTACGVVISDDGLQYYRLARDVEIAIMDSQRGFGNRTLLPAGPLREPISRLKTVDFILHHGEKKENSLSMQLVAGDFVNAMDPNKKVTAEFFKNKKIHAVAGIGNPDRFFNSLRSMGLDMIPHIFPDHYFFKASDIDFGKECVIMTEKDIVKCEAFARENHWYLPVAAQFDEHFLEAILLKI